MLGHRGCRLGITYPEIYDMQVRAVFEAACEACSLLGFLSDPPSLLLRVRSTWWYLPTLPARPLSSPPLSTTQVKKQGKPCAPPEVMIPLVGNVEEFTILKENCHKVAAAVMKEHKVQFKYMVGTMIEVRISLVSPAAQSRVPIPPLPLFSRLRFLAQP